MTSRLAVLPILILTVGAAGCFQQVPMTTTTPAPATRVVVLLTDSGTVAMGNAIGSGALEVEGIVTTADPNQWTMQLLRVDHRDQRTIEWNRELVTFPRNVITNPSVVVLDKKRSFLTAVGVAVGAVLAARAFHLLGGDDESKDDDQTPESSLVPIWSGMKK